MMLICHLGFGTYLSTSAVRRPTAHRLSKQCDRDPEHEERRTQLDDRIVPLTGSCLNQRGDQPETDHRQQTKNAVSNRTTGYIPRLRHLIQNHQQPAEARIDRNREIHGCTLGFTTAVSRIGNQYLKLVHLVRGKCCPVHVQTL